jgi:hypothetical protein
MGYFFLALVILLYTLTGSQSTGFQAQLNQIVKPHVFNVAGWEIATLTHELTTPPHNGGDAASVIRYFQLVDQANYLDYRLEWAAVEAPEEIGTIQAELDQVRGDGDALQEVVEQVLEKQIREAYTGQRIYSPWPGWQTTFPPINFKLTTPPKMLIVSPRDRIENTGETMLRPDTSLADIEDIENRVDLLGVSSLVTDIGGLGATYPAFVANDMDLQSTINAAAEEWLHQYLAFTPLGFRYVLDSLNIAPDYDVATMNETLAGIVSKEIGTMVYNKYYRELLDGNVPQVGEPKANENPDAKPAFDFNTEMREIRQQVDLYLSRGQVEEAEKYMQEKRDYLVSQGYYIRKLNQAYFAFHGTYADSPTSIDPIGTEMKQLRTTSPSLKEFLDDISAMTSRQELKTAAGG